MSNYEIRVYPIECEDGSVSWGASFPAVNGCAGGGDTPEEAIKEAYENLEVYITYLKEKGEPIPQANEKYSGKFVVRITSALHRTIARQAEMNGVSLNHYVAEVLAAGGHLK
jgi:antitoxin HicB